MHALIELGNVEQLLKTSGRVSANWRVEGIGPSARSILKFKSGSVCEVFAYELAGRLDVRVARMQGFWTREPISHPEAPDEPGNIGVLVEYHDDWQDLGDEYAASLDPVGAARVLALCAFTRGEWGTFGRSRGAVYFADLEKILPAMQPSVLMSLPADERVEVLERTATAYRLGHAYVDEVLEEAGNMHIRDRLLRELRSVAGLDADAYSDILRISGHPLSGLLSRYAAGMFGERLNEIRRRLDLPLRDVPDWR